MYWEKYNANGAVKPDEGGMLDQDYFMHLDLTTYAWLVGFAENILDAEEEAKKGPKR